MAMKIGFISTTKTAHSSLTRVVPEANAFKFNKGFLTIGKHQWLKNNGKLNDYEFLFTSVRNPYDRFVSSYKECCKRYGYKDFLDKFIIDYANGKLNEMQMWHTQPQSFHLILEDIDHIIRVENLTEDTKELCRKIAKPEPKKIPWVNKSAATIELNERQRAAVADLFSEDFKQLNYET
jgi:hypothetical protein